MKKILFVFLIYVPSLAMDPSSYETRLENVETAVVEIKDVLNDKTDSSTGEITPGLKTKVEGIEDVLNDKEDPETHIKVVGLISQVEEINNALDDVTDFSTGEITLGLKSRVKDIEDILDEGETVPGLKVKVDEISTTLKNEGIPGLKTKVDGIDTTLKNEGIPGLKTKVDEINATLKNEGIPGLKTKVDEINATLKNEGIPGLKTKVDEINATLSNEGIPGLKSKVENNMTKIDNLTDIVSGISAIITKLQANIAGIALSVNTLQRDMYDQVDPETQKVTPGLKTLVETNIPLIKPLQDEVEGIALGISGLTAAISGLPEIIKNINEKIDKGWDTFLEEKFQEYMEVKKKVLDIIAKCKTDEEPIPTYIVETSEQLQAMDLEMRRLVLSEILTKLKVFEFLLDSKNNPILDSNKMKSLQTYLDNTNVPKPDLKEIQPTLSYVIEGEYIKVSGETRKFTRSAGFKTGLPKENWMDQSCDYFAYGFLPVLKDVIFPENDERGDINEQIRKENAKAQAAYDAGISAAEKEAFPADNLTTLINDYNRILLHHEI